MATQGIGTVRRSRRGITLIAVALTFTAVVLLAQATSIWSSGTGDNGQAEAHVTVSAQHVPNVGHIPPGCRPKYGCPSGTTSGRP